MSCNNFISKLLDIQDISECFIENVGGEKHIHLKHIRKKCTCPSCGRLTDKIHDYREQKVKDLSVGGKRTYLFPTAAGTLNGSVTGFSISSTVPQLKTAASRAVPGTTLRAACRIFMAKIPAKPHRHARLRVPVEASAADPREKPPLAREVFVYNTFRPEKI